MTGLQKRRLTWTGNLETGGGWARTTTGLPAVAATIGSQSSAWTMHSTGFLDCEESLIRKQVPQLHSGYQVGRLSENLGSAARGLSFLFLSSSGCFRIKLINSTALSSSKGSACPLKTSVHTLCPFRNKYVSREPAGQQPLFLLLLISRVGRRDLARRSRPGFICSSQQTIRRQTMLTDFLYMSGLSKRGARDRT